MSVEFSSMMVKQVAAKSSQCLCPLPPAEEERTVASSMLKPVTKTCFPNFNAPKIKELYRGVSPSYF